jgi:RNA-splicing ligase RtcB
MNKLKGDYGTGYVTLGWPDSKTFQQIYECLNHPALSSRVVFMPDYHYGAGVVIGFTMPMTDKIIPNVVGVDIGCGMLLIFVGKSILAEMSEQDIDSEIRYRIPFGPNVRESYDMLVRMTMIESNGLFNDVSKTHSIFTRAYNERFGTDMKPVKYNMKWLEKKSEDIGMDIDRVLKSIGTLGGGNHFIEIGKSEQTKEYAATVHSGSRQFGLKICNYWQRKGKGSGQLAYLESDDMFGYLTDMIFAQHYAQMNRVVMASTICDVLKIGQPTAIPITSVHNYIDFDDFIIRKGAIKAYSGQKMIIPFNMEDGLLICEGKSNPNWNYSAPHGAGRVGSRKKAKEKMKKKISTVKERMKNKGIYTSLIPADETKEAYKDPKIIEDAIEPTAKVIDRVKPILNMKARK